jgi:hypothetical protein
LMEEKRVSFETFSQVYDEVTLSSKPWKTKNNEFYK